MAFNVGDRVEFVGKYPRDFKGQTAVVGAIRRRNVCVHFDDPTYEKRQSYAAGWPADTFAILIDDPVEPEDWS